MIGIALRGRLLVGTIALCGLLPVAVVGAQEATSPDLQIADRPFGRYGSTVIARFFVNAPPERAYRILADHDRLSAFMPLVEESRFIGQRGGKALVRFRIRYMRYVDIIEVDERVLVPFKRIAWHAIEGPLAVSDGTWSFEPQRGGTAITYQTDVDPGLPVPAWLTARLLKEGLPAFIEAVRRRIESDGQWHKAP